MATESSIFSTIHVSLDDTTAWVRVRGRGQFSRAHALRQFADRMLTEGRFLLCIDLAECVSMDSTFIGTLAMIAMEGTPRTPVVRLLNVRETVRVQLADLGVSSVFEFSSSEASAEPFSELTQTAASSNTGGRQTKQTMLQAHEALTRLSPGNERKFKDVIAFLREQEDHA
jgi:anti-anti-sigma regulatory factor